MSRARSHLSLVLCILAASCVVVSGCSKKDNSAPTAESNASGSAVAAAALPTGDLENALKAVPKDASAVVSMAFPMSLSEMTTGFGFVPFDPVLAKEMQLALLEHSKTHLGIDASKVRSIVVFGHVTPEPAGAAIFSPVEGTIKGDEITEDNIRFIRIMGDDSIVATQSGTTLIVGRKDSVKSALEAMKSGAGLAKSDTAFAKEVKEHVTQSYFSATADITKLPIPKMAMTEGLSHGGVAFGGKGLALSVHGKKDTLELLVTTAKGGLQMATNMAKQNMESSKDEFAEGTAGIMGYYMAKNLGSMIDPKIEGDHLTLDFAFDAGGSGAMVFVAVTGVLAAVAIPAFMKYIKKSKTSEANMFLRKLSNGARSFGMENGKMPASVGPTPAKGACCQQGGDKCAPQAELWQNATWKALNFAIMDPHYYSYEFVNSAGKFEVRAYGDLDCDGQFSTFTMQVPGPSGDAVAGDVFIENGLE